MWRNWVEHSGLAHFDNITHNRAREIVCEIKVYTLTGSIFYGV